MPLWRGALVKRFCCKNFSLQNEIPENLRDGPESCFCDIPNGGLVQHGETAANFIVAQRI